MKTTEKDAKKTIREGEREKRNRKRKRKRKSG